MEHVRSRFSAHTVLFLFFSSSGGAGAGSSGDRREIAMGWRERRKCQGQPPLFVPAFGFPGPAAWSGGMRMNAGRRGRMGEDLVSVLGPCRHSSLVDGGWCARQLVSLQNSSVRCCWCREFSSKGQPPVLVCNSVSILCGSRQGKRCEMAFGPMTTI